MIYWICENSSENKNIGGEAYFMKIIKVTLTILFCIFSVFSALVLLFGLSMLINGSLEMFPTEEQIEKVRISGWLLVVIGTVLEAVSVTVLYKINKRKKN